MILSILPLPKVLLPGTQLPVHIYEPEQRLFVVESMRNQSVFGVTLIEGNRLNTVGCTARVVMMNRNFPDEHMKLVIEGVQRFKIRKVLEHNRHHALAKVFLIPEQAEPFDLKLVTDSIATYNEVVQKIFGKGNFVIDLTNLPDDNLSYIMATKAGLDIDQMQIILELKTENTRLEVLTEHMRRILPTLENAETRYRLMRYDGYLPPQRFPPFNPFNPFDFRL